MLCLISLSSVNLFASEYPRLPRLMKRARLGSFRNWNVSFILLSFFISTSRMEHGEETTVEWKMIESGIWILEMIFFLAFHSTKESTALKDENRRISILSFLIVGMEIERSFYCDWTFINCYLKRIENLFCSRKKRAALMFYGIINTLLCLCFAVVKALSDFYGIGFSFRFFL